MALDFVWWCAECEQEVSSPEEHSQIYPSHTYIEKMRWTGDIITPIVPEVVQESINEEVATLSGSLCTIINNTVNESSKYYYVNSNDYVTTTSTSWGTVVSLQINIDEGGWYRIGWSFIWGFSRLTGKQGKYSIYVGNDDKAACFNILLNNTSVLSEYYIYPNTFKNKKFDLCGFKPILLDSGNNVIEIQIRSYNKGDSVKIFNASLEAQKIIV